jgi:hypothetical protein
MIGWGRNCERTIAATAAVLLQAALYLALSHERPSGASAANAPRSIAMILAAARPQREAPPPVSRMSEKPIGKLAVEPLAPPPITPFESPTQSSRPTFDWGGAIQGEVRKLTRPAAPPKLRFGFFPVMPVEKTPPHWNGWDEARIDRTQRLAHGIIDLGVGCVIVLWFPIPQCHSEPARGDLFKHMRDRPDEGPGALP